MSILKNRKRAEQKQQLKKSDIDLYKMTGVFAIACIFVLFVFKMKSTQIGAGNLTYAVYELFTNPLFLVMASGVFLASVVWFVYSKNKKIDESRRIFTSTNGLVLAVYLAIFVVCFGMSKTANLHGFFITLTVVGAVVYYVSKIYNPDFTMFSAITAVNVLAVYLLAYRFDAMFVVLKILIVGFGVGAVVLFDKRIKNMKLSKKRKDSFLIYPAFVSVAMGAIFMFVKFLSTLAYYFPAGTLQAEQSSATLTVKIANFAASVDLKVMFMAFLIEYIVFAIIYTLRLIRD